MRGLRLNTPRGSVIDCDSTRQGNSKDKVLSLRIDLYVVKGVYIKD